MADHAATPKFILPKLSYDVLKPITTTVLPGLSALYIALATLWGFPNAREIVGTITAVNVFLGLLVTLSSHQFQKTVEDIPEITPVQIEGYDGTFKVGDPQDPSTFTMSLDAGPEELATKDAIVFKVDRSSR